MNIQYGIVVIDIRVTDGDPIVHFVGFENQPTETDFISLREELETDNEFGLVGQAEYLEFSNASDEIMDMYKKIIGDTIVDI